MTLCSCCLAEIPTRVIATKFGRFESPYGVCRRCWRRIPSALRRHLVKALRLYRDFPTLERARELFELYQVCIGEPLGRRYSYSTDLEAPVWWDHGMVTAA